MFSVSLLVVPTIHPLHFPSPTISPNGGPGNHQATAAHGAPLEAPKFFVADEDMWPAPKKID